MNKDIDELTNCIVKIFANMKENNPEITPCVSCLSEALYNAGYRKILDENNRSVYPELYNFETLVRIQAIKEFAEKLRNKFYILNKKPYDTLHNFEIDDLVNAEIDFLLKEYGVEIDKE